MGVANQRSLLQTQRIGSQNPTDGYTMMMKNLTGTTMILASNLNWDLIYDTITKQWDYHSINH